MNVRIEVTGDGEDPGWVEGTSAFGSHSACLGILAIAGEKTPRPWIDAWNSSASGVPLIGTTLKAFSDGTRVFRNGAVLITLMSENTSCHSALAEAHDRSFTRAASDLFRQLRRRRGQASRRYPKRAIIALASGGAFPPKGLADRLIIEGGAGFELIGASSTHEGSVTFTDEGVCDLGIAAVELLLQEEIYFGERNHGPFENEVIRVNAIDRSMEIASSQVRCELADISGSTAQIAPPPRAAGIDLTSQPVPHGFCFTRNLPDSEPLCNQGHGIAEEPHFVYFETSDPFVVSEHSTRSANSYPSTTCVFP